MNSMYQQLLQLPLFQGVSAEKISALVEKLPFHFLKFRNGETITAMGEPCSHMRFVVSGKVRLETQFSHVKVSLVQTLPAPHVLAPDFLFGMDTRYPFTATADGPCGILQLRKSDYIQMLNTDKIFLFNILNRLSMGSQGITMSLLAIKQGSVAERLAIIVDAFTTQSSTDITFKYRQKDLCALLGTQRTTLTDTLERLREKGIVEPESNQLRIIKPRDLHDIIKR